MNIEVSYNGSFPNACRGTLIIQVEGEIVYKKSHCCHSLGSVWFDENFSEHIESGELVWGDDSEIFSEEIQQAVKEKLSNYSVCCGGCV